MPDGQLEEGSLLNERFRIIAVIGQGGMGTVYRAEHVRLNTTVAVKEIRGQSAPTGTAQQGTIEQYEQEARILVQLNHPNLPKVTDAFVDSGRLYLVMDFVEGENLDLRRRSIAPRLLDIELVVGWGIEIAQVLSYLHRQTPSIIFRDLKPSNVMVQPDGHIKLIDFGIARKFQPGANKDTELLGSVGYSPPEQFGRQQTDTRSDIYALGATLHQLLTGHDPASSPFKFPPAHSINPQVPITLSRLIESCLALEPEHRPADAGEVAGALTAIKGDLQRPVGTEAAERTLASARITSTKLKDAERSRPKPVAGTSASSQPLRIALGLGLTAILTGGILYGTHSVRRSKPSGDLIRRAQASSQTAGSNPNSAAPPAPSTVPTAPTSGQPASENSVTPPKSGAETQPPTTSSPVDKSSGCRSEVLGVTPDGKSIRIHVAGQIGGKKDTTGMVAVYFYNADKSPLPARDPMGSNASPTGQLFSQFTIQIDSDAKPIDGTLDIPLEQFTSMTGVLYRCIVYSDNQSMIETDLMPLVGDTQPSGPAHQ